MGETIHKFEAAGLGKAPFKVVGISREVFQAIPGDPSCPIQPAGSCDYCGQAIYIQVRVVGADGRKFKVGCDCAGKVGDAGLRKAVSAFERKEWAAKVSAQAGSLNALLADPAVRAALAAKPHPNTYRAAKGDTMLSWAEFMATKAGAAGRAKALRAARAA